LSAGTYRSDIDGLRAIAVVSVVLFHLDIVLFSGGFVGVDVFFVISGFLITNLIVAELERSGSFRFKNFYLRRMRRLAPALLFTLFISTIGAALVFSPADMQRYGEMVTTSIFSVSNIYFWSQAGYFDAGIEFFALLHTWSLSVEEQFYLLWPITLVFVFLKKGKKAAFITILILSFISFGLNLIFDERFLSAFNDSLTHEDFDKYRAAMFYLTPFRIFELGIGAALVFLIKPRESETLRDKLFFVSGLLLIAYAIFFFDEETVFPSYNALIPCVGTALIIYARVTKGMGVVLSNRLMIGLGLISYSFYLIHWPFIVFTKYWTLSALTLWQQIGLFIASGLAATFMYFFIEQPFRRPPQTANPLQSHRRYVYSILALVAIFVISVGNGLSNKGWLWRLDDEKRSIIAQIDNPRDFHRNYYGGKNCGNKDVCRVNIGAGDNIYFIGDSHSKALSEGLAYNFPQYQFTHIDNRCRFNTLDMCYVGKWDEKSYFKQKRDSLDELKKNTDKVIINQAWFRRPVYLDVNTNQEISLKTINDHVEFVVKEMVKVEEFLGQGRVIVVGEVNRFGRFGNPLTCISRPFGFNKCAFREPTFSVKFNDRLEKALAEKNIPFFSPTKALCDKKQCKNFIDGLPAYSDPGHLSTWGSRHVIQSFKPELASYLER